MVKIKQKKQLTLPQLIEWAWENEIKSHIIRADKQLMNIQFDEHGDFRTYGFTGIDTTFTVEVEEEITKDTVFEEILLIVNNGLGIEVYYNYSINDVLSNNEGYYEETVMLILKPDPKFIWTREKGLVE
ncbi:hypothetical protein ACVDHH_01250 [Staphylococcus saprophyticus]